MQKIACLLTALVITPAVLAGESMPDVVIPAPQPEVAAEPLPLVRQSGEIRFNANGGVYFIDQQLARDKRISDEVLYFGLAIQKHSAWFEWVAGIDLLRFGDHVDNNLADSQTSGLDLYFEVGHEFRFKQYAFALYGGYNFISGERTYSDCSFACPDESFGLESGVYVRPALMYYLDNRVSAELSYKSILDRNVESAVQFGMGLRF